MVLDASPLEKSTYSIFEKVNSMAQPSEESVKQIKKIMINCPSWMGDAVMSLPAITAMSQNFPQAKITLLANSWVADLYDNLSFVDGIILYSPKGAGRGPLGLFKAVKTIRHQSFDLALLLQNAFRPALLTWLAGVPHRWGYATDGRGFLLTRAIRIDFQIQQHHQILYYLQLLEKLGLCKSPTNIEIKLSPQQQKETHKLLTGKGLDLKKTIIGIHPAAAYGEAKRWLPERYAQLSDRIISEAGLQVIFFGAQQDIPLVENIVMQMNNKSFVLVGQTNLKELMGAVSCCNLFIANDSGPMHLAAALGIPVVAIFGPTDEKRTAPLGKQHIIIKKAFPCSPCNHRICPSDHRCMTAVTVDEVYQAVIKKIGIRQS